MIYGELRIYVFHSQKIKLLVHETIKNLTESFH